LASDGTPLGPQFVVNEGGPDEYVDRGLVASRPSGEFVVVWDDGGAYGQRYAAAGSPLGGNFLVESSGAGSAYEPAVATRPNGGFLVAWRESGVWVRRYDEDGVPLQESLPVSEEGHHPWGVLVESDPGGGFVVAWTDGYPYPEPAFWARRFSAGGVPLGPPFRVDSGSSGWLRGEALAMEAAGDVVLSWSQQRSPATKSGIDVWGRRFALDGAPLGSEFRLNSYTTGDQRDVRIVLAENGDLVAVWQSEGSTGGDTSGTSIQARRFRLPFFIDGFESGNLTRWSSSLP